MAKKMGMKHSMEQPTTKSAKDSWGVISMEKEDSMEAKCDMQSLLQAKEIMDSTERMKAAMDYAKVESKKISSLSDLKSAMANATDEMPEEESAEEAKSEKEEE